MATLAIGDAETEDADSPWEVSSDSEPDSESQQQPLQKPDNTAMSPQAKQLLEATQLAVKCLYILPLRKPAPLDRLHDEFMEDREPSPFAEYDLRCVRDKFPALEPLAQRRLARMITRRRQLLVYRREHTDRLATKEKSESDTEDSQNSGSGAKKREKDGDRGLPLDVKAAREQRTGPATRYTRATTVLIDPAVPFIMEKNLAQLHSAAAPFVEDDARTSVAGSRATREIHLEVPPRLKRSDGTPVTLFKCNYCSIPVQITNDRSWRYVQPTV